MTIVYYNFKPPKRYGFWHLLFDFTMTLLTCGLWLLWILIKFLRSNTK
jgi:hypothetical protein